ncbi:MAG TPA: HlyD family efflux transporter periplasmic adaptor subunit [Candidatus Eisenbacteria bacterium]
MNAEVQPGRRRPNPRIIVPVALVVIGAVAAIVVVRQQNGDAFTASGTVEATEAQLGFTVPGRVVTVRFWEGDRVAKGGAMAALDTLQAAAERDQAVGQVAAARAALTELERGSRPEEIQQARAARDGARQRVTDAQQDFDRTQELIRDGVVSQQSFDKAKIALDVAKSDLRQAEEALRLVEQGPRRERVAAQRAQLAAAQAALAAEGAQLANMVIRAPFDGVVTVRHHEPGEIVAAGSPVLSLMNRDDRWVRIYISEARVGGVRIGQKASITCDTFRGRRYEGTVIYISSEAEFTPKNVQTQEERVKLVYAVKVRITGDPGYDLKPGMPADVRLEPPV